MRRWLVIYNVCSPVVFIVLWAMGHFWLGLGLLFVGHMLALWATLVPGCTWWGPVETRIPGQGKQVLLTFDDGPDAVETPAVLELLAQAHRKAVFFVIGEKAKAHPDLIHRILAEGHEIGNHTQTHPQTAFWRLPPARLHWEIERCQQTLQAITGEKPRWFRPPAGHQNPFLARILKDHHLVLLGWTARGFDGVERNPDKVLRRLLPQIRPGATVLLHEGRGTLLTTLPPVLAKAAECEAAE